MYGRCIQFTFYIQELQQFFIVDSFSQQHKYVYT